ncbi:hypothetical protein RO3G_07830 [Rhizopus delemar RA 99-880]|uniref:Uncharacterized protein n=1 Tax=Rhizopus delemar (strain RA 99-880 / ATCC MYA-4621 / FGSC 9543 / NRRL 43880) TaxID=246409 RepID=I1C3U5_RHIO9|nr:hypothetical protein RO3G_07830 [Rhizopus delemar RA 99-880]|eukprot:EIE83125.1 hypothetical protein RO3G_07830 [Rhizopus delemar RA 99-880]
MSFDVIIVGRLDLRTLVQGYLLSICFWSYPSALRYFHPLREQDSEKLQQRNLLSQSCSTQNFHLLPVLGDICIYYYILFGEKTYLNVIKAIILKKHSSTYL